MKKDRQFMWNLVSWGIVLVFILGAARMCCAETVGQVHQSLLNRGVYFDQVRFDTTITIDFVNDIQRLIATIGKTNEARTVIVPSSGDIFGLPSDFYLIDAVVINQNPVDPGSETNFPYALQYAPANMIGKISTSQNARPKNYSIWNDSLRISPESPGDDTLTIYYFRMPTAVNDTADLIDLPDRYVVYLKEVLIQMALERITFPQRSPREEGLALVRLIEQAILERPPDDK